MTSDPLDDSQFDWRVEDKGKVAAPHPLAGRRILQVSMMKDAQRGLTSFTTPHPAALSKIIDERLVMYLRQR